MKLEQVRCALCQANDCEPILSARDYRSSSYEQFGVVRCRRCGLAYTNPRPAEKELHSHYGQSYRAFGGFSNPLLKWLRQLRTKRDIGLWKTAIPPDGRLLEVGCGTGDLLAALHYDGGWDVTGVELSPYACRLARESWGLTVYQGELPNVPLEADSFDGIIMRHTLEHLPDPLAVLKSAFRVMRPGGKCFLLVPNFASLEARIFGPRWYDLDLPRHLFHFTPTTIRSLLEMAGFHVTGFRGDLAPNGWVGSLQNLLQDLRISARFTRLWDVRNPVALAFLWPASFICSPIGGSGRIWVRAEKPQLPSMGSSDG